MSNFSSGLEAWPVPIQAATSAQKESKQAQLLPPGDDPSERVLHLPALPPPPHLTHWQLHLPGGDGDEVDCGDDDGGDNDGGGDDGGDGGDGGDDDDK